MFGTYILYQIYELRYKLQGTKLWHSYELLCCLNSNGILKKCCLVYLCVLDWAGSLHLVKSKYCIAITARKVSKYRVFPGPYFPVFGLEKTPYLDTFHVVHVAIHKFNTIVIKDNTLKNLLALRALYFNVTNNRKIKKNVNFVPLSWRAQSIRQKILRMPYWK